MQKETNMVVASRMTCKIGLIWHHMKTLYSAIGRKNEMSHADVTVAL